MSLRTLVRELDITAGVCDIEHPMQAAVFVLSLTGIRAPKQPITHDFVEAGVAHAGLHCREVGKPQEPCARALFPRR